MNEREPIHPWRWRALAVIILVMGVSTFIAIQQTRSALEQLRQEKASVAQLEVTNCGLRDFLIAAERARQRLAGIETGKKKASDQAAVKGYKVLAAKFSPDNCTRLTGGKR